MFGSVHPQQALEFVLWLQRTNFDGHIYFDTFPRNEDPVAEAEANSRTFKTFWRRAEALKARGLDAILAKHDALAGQRLLEEVEAGDRR